MGYVRCSRPGARAPARSDGEHRPGIQDKRPGAVGEQNSPGKESDMRSSDRFACYGRSRKNIVHVAYGGIKVRDFFRPGAPGGMEQLLWDQRSSSGEAPEVAMARRVVPFS